MKLLKRAKGNLNASDQSLLHENDLMAKEISEHQSTSKFGGSKQLDSEVSSIRDFFSNCAGVMIVFAVVTAFSEKKAMSEL